MSNTNLPANTLPIPRSGIPTPHAKLEQQMALAADPVAAAMLKPNGVLGAEAANVIELTLALEDLLGDAPTFVATNEPYLRVRLYMDAELKQRVDPAAYTATVTTGTAVAGDGSEDVTLISTVAGAAVLDITDVAGGSDTTIYALISGAPGGGLVEPQLVAVTFDNL